MEEDKYLKIVKGANTPLTVTDADGKLLTYNHLTLEIGLSSPPVFILDGSVRNEEVWLDLDYVNFSMEGFLDLDLKVVAKARDHGSEGGKYIVKEEYSLPLKLVQYFRFDTDLDGKPNLTITATLWDESDYKQAMGISLA